MRAILIIITVLAMNATVAWFLWNPNGWVLQWEPIVVFLTLAIGLLGLLYKEDSGKSLPKNKNTKNAHPSDVKLFQEFIEILPSSGIIYFLKKHDFLTVFHTDDIQPLRKYLQTWDNAEHEFQDPILEKAHKELMKEAKILRDHISRYCFSDEHGRLATRVDRLKHIDEHEERFKREAAKINDAAETVVRLHQELIRHGRRRLS